MVVGTFGRGRLHLPLCDGILDKYGDHCLVCPCGGDRTKRHNRLRNQVFHFCAGAGLNPELEKPGLLQPRPCIGALSENGVSPTDSSARRPADVYLPRWRQGMPLALDFAVTSGLRHDTVRASMLDATAPLTMYEDHKRNHLDTARLCSEEGLAFAPVVVEAGGGAWGPTAQKIYSELAQTKSLITGESKSVILNQLFQNLGVTLHRENARSILKRMRRFTHNIKDVLVAATALQTTAAEAASDAAL